jgi:N,N'-diacetyllegionaminate synthase
MTGTCVIAEIGENHAGDWELARKMIAAAARAGADVVKFQSYRGSDVSTDDPEKDWFRRVEVSDSLHFELKKIAEQHGVRFLSSCFTLERAKFLVEQLGLRQVKVASSEMLDFELLDYLNTGASTVFLSTGMATLDEVREAVSRLHDVPDVYILHCTTLYPCPPDDANLRALQTLQQAFPARLVGYSDHTVGSLASVIAVGLGARVIEKHFTLDRSLPGTDHVLSATPEELRRLVDDIRMVESLLGSSEKKPTRSEVQVRDAVRNRFPKAPSIKRC